MFALAAFGIAMPGPAQGQNDDRIKRLERIIEEQQKRLEEQQKKIGEQEQRLKSVEARRAPTTGEKPRAESPAPPLGLDYRPIFHGKNLFANTWTTELPDSALERFRGGATVNAVRIILPDGTSLLAPADSIQLVQGTVPRQPDFRTEPERTEPEQPARPRRARPAPVPPGTRTGQPARPGQPPATPPTTPPPSTGETERAKSEKPVDQLLLERGAILLKPGTLQIEPSFEYSRFSTDRVAINGLVLFQAIIIGTIRVDSLEREIITGNLRARYGITNRIQVDLSVPVQYRRETEIFGVGTPDVLERTVTGFGIGDIEAGVTGQAWIGGGWVPNVLIRVAGRFPTGKSAFDIGTETVESGTAVRETRLKESPTGSGFFSVSATATFVWTIDPVAFFTGVGYTANLPRSPSGFGRIDPGDSYNFFAGMNVAVSERVSLNYTFIHEHAFSSRVGGNVVPGTSFTDARMVIGTSIGLRPNISLNINASLGLTKFSPDFAFSVAVPVTFLLQ